MEKKLVAKILSQFNYFLIRSLESSLHFSIPLGIINALGFSGFYFLFPNVEIWWLDLIGTILSTLVIASAYDFVLSKKHLHIYWFLFLLYLPFNGAYLIFSRPGSMPDAVGFVLVLMLLILVISSIRLLLSLLLIGMLLAYLAHDSLHINPMIVKHLIEVGPTYLLGFIYAIILSRKRWMMERKREGMETVHRLKHELNTPLMSIQGNCTLLQKHIPQLISVYKAATKEKLGNQVIQPPVLKHLPVAAQQACNECTAAGSIMDIMTMNAKEPEQRYKERKRISIYCCIEKALQRYPFPTGFDPKKQLTWHKSNDFHFDGVEILMIHVFINLLKNAVYSILETGRSGRIDIYNDYSKKLNYVYIKDTGIGVEKKNMNYLFDSFFTTHREGTGLGLPFCKSTIENFSGKIYCQSVYGKGATFILELPKKAKNKTKKGLFNFKPRFIHS